MALQAQEHKNRQKPENFAQGGAVPDTLNPSKTYHHGNLRPALVEAALELLETAGSEGVSLRGIARKAGVSQAAPYAHFRDKTELLAAVAELGFQRLAFALLQEAAPEKAISRSPASARLQRLCQLLQAHIRFGKENPALYRLMMAPEFGDMKAFPTLALSAGKSYGLYASALRQVGAGANASAENPARPNPDATRNGANALWAMAHGMTLLILDGKMPPSCSGQDMIERMLSALPGQALE